MRLAAKSCSKLVDALAAIQSEKAAISWAGPLQLISARVGEKDHFDYLVRWIHNPRERTRPFCPHEKRDLGPEDYAKKGLPFVFDLDHTTCPNDGHELQVQQMTVMPNLRLTVQEAQDIASYLITLKKADASYPAANYLDDPQQKEKGLASGETLRLRRLP